MRVSFRGKVNSKTFKWRLVFQNQPRLLYLAGCLRRLVVPLALLFVHPGTWWSQQPLTQRDPASWLPWRSINWLWFLLQQYVIIPSKLAFKIEIFRRLLTAASISVWQLLFQQSWRKSAAWLCPRPATVALWPRCFPSFPRHLAVLPFTCSIRGSALEQPTALWLASSSQLALASREDGY